jgi:O-antigen/teichoic acid export membrane protein
MIMVVVNLLLMIVLLPQYGITGVLSSLIISELITIGAYYFSIKSKYNGINIRKLNYIL